MPNEGEPVAGDAFDTSDCTGAAAVDQKAYRHLDGVPLTFQMQFRERTCAEGGAWHDLAASALSWGGRSAGEALVRFQAGFPTGGLISCCANRRRMALPRRPA